MICLSDPRNFTYEGGQTYLEQHISLHLRCGGVGGGLCIHSCVCSERETKLEIRGVSQVPEGSTFIFTLKQDTVDRLTLLFLQVFEECYCLAASM